jgi:DNA polymerase-1
MMSNNLPKVLSALGYRHAWAIDFEFMAPAGHKPEPVCMVSKCLITGQVIRLWGDELTNCPFQTDTQDLFIAFYASAESSCFDALDWPPPTRLLDLFTEFRCLTNGPGASYGNGLIGAQLYFGLPAIAGEEKDAMRDLIMRGGPWSEHEMDQIVAYCESDVDALAALLEAMLPLLTSHPGRFGQALLRGRYMAAAGVVENNGIPIDSPLWSGLVKHWGAIKTGLIAEIDADYNTYEGGRFSTSNFALFLTSHNIPWPRLPSGALALDDDTFRIQARSFPILAPLRELRHALGQLRLSKLSIGPDGRNRTILSAFRAKTGRNQPSNSRFIFGPSVWIRHLIKPTEGNAIAYIDWSSQEIAIAGALSGDNALWEAYSSGDPYIAFAKQAGLAPPEATKQTHPEIRNACKAVVLGVNYGMGAESIAAQSGIHIDRARELLRLHRDTYHLFWRWAEENVERVLLGLPLDTVFGWRIHFPPGCNTEVNARSILNWPMQSHGAEMMRLGLSMAIEAGYKICAPIHDALLLEAPIAEIDQQAAAVAEIMAQASEVVLGAGKRCRSDVKIVSYPARFEDEARGSVMFSRVLGLLKKAQQDAP